MTKKVVHIFNRVEAFHLIKSIANISPNELSQILDNISKTGAKGVSIFSGNEISDEQFLILGSYKDLK